MKLYTLTRSILAPLTTVGTFARPDGTQLCHTLEDKFRPPPEPKVFAQTCIPCGRYEVQITRSPRFSQLAGRDVFLPLLFAVPGFTGVRLHGGNKHDDTEGCPLLGLEIVQANGVHQIAAGTSTPAVKKVMESLTADGALERGRVWLDVRLA